PDDFISEFGAEAFQNQVIKSSLTFTSFYMKYLKKDYNLSLEGDRIQYIEKLLEYLATIESSVEREYYLKEVSDSYNVSMDSLKQEILSNREKMGLGKDKINKNRYTNKVSEHDRAKKLLPAFHNAERQLLAYMLQDASITDKVQEEIGASFNIEEHKVIATHLYAFYEEHQQPDVSMFVEMLTDDRLKQLVTDIAMMSLHENISNDEINDYIRNIRAENSNKGDIQSLKEEQKLAEQQNDPIKAAGIAMQIIELQKQWKSIN